jgi:hypothetical protein
VQNVTYLGKLREAEQIYKGDHAAIIDSELWERANAAIRLQPSRAGKRRNETEHGKAEVEVNPATVLPSSRISRLLALALKMEQMIHKGVVNNYSDLAELGRVSAARVTQVMNLLHLAPDIQEEILLRKTPQDWLRESAVRKLSSIVLWSEQRDRWQELLAAASV